MRPASSKIIEFEFGHAKVRENILNISTTYAFLHVFTQGRAYPIFHILVFNFLHAINHGEVSPLSFLREVCFLFHFTDPGSP